MKKNILLLFSLMLYFSSFAQPDWLCVNPNKKVYFEDKNKMVYCLRIDSTFNNDTILYPFSDLHKIGEDCYSITSGSWLTKYVALNEDGNSIFVNGNDQQILIKNRADLNEIWQVYENENIKVKGIITEKTFETVLGVEDSVKTISFSVYNLDDEPINHTLNQMSIKISKNFGLVKTVNFYYFEHTKYEYDYNYGFREFILIGISEPQLGFKPSSLKEDYYDFQVGDELHIWDIDLPFAPSYSYERKIIHRYLSRNEYKDSIAYSYERKIHCTTKRFIDGVVVTDFSVSSDTVQQKVIKGKLFSTEPNEPYGEISKIMIKNISLLTMFIQDYDLFYQDSCLRIITADNCGTFPTYYLGLGGPYYPHCEIWGNEYAYDLVYYKKGDVEWGTPFNLSVVEHKKDNSFSIYPNPANNYISIKSTNNEILNNSIIDIYDIQGRKCLSKNIVNFEHIDVACLNAGFYVVKLTQKNKDIIYFKMVKQ